MSYCEGWFVSNTEADKWAKNIKLVPSGLGYYEIHGLPCWDYIVRGDADNPDYVTKILTTYNPHTDSRTGTTWKCWYGVCRHHARIFTVMFQERVKGQYNIIDGKSLKAMYVRTSPHVWLEVYIKNEGYFYLDVSQPYRLWLGHCEGEEMGNRWNCGHETYGLISYNPKWAGVAPTPPKESYIQATSTPTNASIWLKKH